MWNQKSSSKILEKKSRQHSYELHQKKLKSMKSTMCLATPISPKFQASKDKHTNAQKERKMKIETENKMLIKKLKEIQNQDHSFNKLSTTPRKKQNREKIQTVNKVIFKKPQTVEENKKMCLMLMLAKSNYPVQEILNQAEYLERVSYNISQNARRTASQNGMYPVQSEKVSSSKKKKKRLIKQVKFVSSSRLPYETPTERSKSPKTQKSKFRVGTASTFHRTRKATLTPTNSFIKISDNPDKLPKFSG